MFLSKHVRQVAAIVRCCVSGGSVVIDGNWIHSGVGSYNADDILRAAELQNCDPSVMVRELIRVQEHFGSDRSRRSWDSMRPLLRPRIVSKASAGEEDSKGGSFPLGSMLRVIPMLDYPTYRARLSLTFTDGLKVARDQVLAESISNLKQEPFNGVTELVKGPNGLQVYVWSEYGMGASRALMFEKFYPDVKGILGGKMRVALPSAGVLIAFVDDNGEAAAKAHAITVEVFNEYPGPITTETFAVKDDGTIDFGSEVAKAA